MKLSGFQWSIVILLDFFLRGAVFFFRSLNVLTIPIALLLSLFHLGILISVAAFVNTFELPVRRTVLTTLAATNVLFFTIFISAWVLFIKSGRQSSCESYAHNCNWIDGTITALGIQTIIFESIVQLAINVIPFLVVCALSAQRKNSVRELNNN